MNPATEFTVTLDLGSARGLNGRVAQVFLKDPSLPRKTPAITIEFQILYGKPGRIEIEKITPTAPRWGTLEFKRAVLHSLAKAFDVRHPGGLVLPAELAERADVELTEWDEEIDAYNRAHYAFYYRTLDLVSLNIRDSEPHWYDTMGGIATAIFDLVETVPQDAPSVSGHFLRANGMMGGWNFNSTTRTLMYHIPQEGTWIVTPEKAELSNNRGEEFNEIYRPFIKSYENGRPVVEWLKTREVVVQKNHYPYHTPLLFTRLAKNLPHVFAQLRGSRYDRGFPLRWTNLIYPVLPKHHVHTPSVVTIAFEGLVRAVQGEAEDRVIYKALRNLNQAQFLVERQGDLTASSNDATLGDLSCQIMSTLAQEVVDAHKAKASGVEAIYLDLLRMEYEEAMNEHLELDLDMCNHITATLAGVGHDYRLGGEVLSVGADR